MNRTISRLALGALVALGTLTGTAAVAQTFPSKPVTLIVPWPAGGSSDLAFVERPISLTCLILAAVLLGSALLPMLRARREKIALETS